MKFRKGDRVTLSGPHFYRGMEYHNEARDGDVGTVTEVFSDHVGVTWDRTGYGSNVDKSCLAPEKPPPTIEELNLVYRSLGAEPPVSPEATAVAAFLQGMLAATCMEMVNQQSKGLKVASVDQAADELGNYQKYFTVVTESGIRLRVQITPEEGA